MSKRTRETVRTNDERAGPRQRPGQEVYHVLKALPKSKDPITIRMEIILRAGYVTGLGACRDGQLREMYGPDHLDIPHIITYEAFPKKFSAKELQEILIAGIFPEGHDTTPEMPIFDPFSGEIDDGHDGRLQMVRVLIDIIHPYKPQSGSVLNIPSPYLEELFNRHSCFEGGKYEVLRETEMATNVVPYLGLVDLHNDETLVQSGLLLGEKVWLMWPPTKHNLAVMARAYQWSTTEAKQGQKRVFEFYKELEGGVTFVQSPGQWVWIPPYAPHAVFTTETSVLTGYETEFAAKFPLRLENLPLYKAYSDTQVNAKAERQAYAAMVSEYLARILKGEFEKVRPKFPLEPHTTMAQTVAKWDCVKDDFKALVASNKALVTTVKKTWTTFLRKSEDNRCLICGADLHDKKSVPDHFEAAHWGAANTRRKSTKSAPQPARKASVRGRKQSDVSMAGMSDDMSDLSSLSDD